MKRLSRLLPHYLCTTTVHLTDKRKIRRLHESPVGTWTDFAAFGEDIFGARCIASDDVDAQFVTVIRICFCQGFRNIRAATSGGPLGSLDMADWMTWRLGI